MILIIVRFVCRSIIIGSTSLLVAIQLLLRKKAAEELKKEQERKSAERRRIIEERCGKPKDLENASEGIVENFLDILLSITISPSIHSTLESIIIDYYDWRRCDDA